MFNQRLYRTDRGKRKATTRGCVLSAKQGKAETALALLHASGGDRVGAGNVLKLKQKGGPGTLAVPSGQTQVKGKVTERADRMIQEMKGEGSQRECGEREYGYGYMAAQTRRRKKPLGSAFRRGREIRGPVWGEVGVVRSCSSIMGRGCRGGSAAVYLT